MPVTLIAHHEPSRNAIAARMRVTSVMTAPHCFGPQTKAFSGNRGRISSLSDRRIVGDHACTAAREFQQRYIQNMAAFSAAHDYYQTTTRDRVICRSRQNAGSISALMERTCARPQLVELFQWPIHDEKGRQLLQAAGP